MVEINKDSVDYRDPTTFDDGTLQSISAISIALRHKLYGVDVREAMAQQGEALVKLIGETGGNSNAEVIAARGNHATLGGREDAQDNQISLSQLSSQSAADVATEALQRASASNQAAPLGVYDTLDQLKTAYPAGANGIFVVKADNQWYYWNKSTWVAGGSYPGTTTEDFSKMAIRTKLNQFNLKLNKQQRLTGENSDGSVKITTQNDSSYVVLDYGRLTSGVLSVPIFDNFTNGQFVAFVGKDGKVFSYFTYQQIVDLKNDYESNDRNLARYFKFDDNGQCYIFVGNMNAFQGDKLSKIYLGFPNNADAKGLNIFCPESLDKQKYMPWLNYSGASLLSIKTYARISYKYDTSTNKPVYETYNGRYILNFDISKHKQGNLYIPKPRVPKNANGSYDTGQFFYDLNENNERLYNRPYQNDGYPQTGDGARFEVLDKEIVFHLSGFQGTILQVMIPSNFEADFYERYEGVFEPAEAFPEIKQSDGKLNENNFNLPPYAITVDNGENYIYFDNILLGKNYYLNEVTAKSSGMLDDKAIIKSSKDGKVSITYNEDYAVEVPYKVAPSKISGEYNFLAIGESTTEADAYMAMLKEMLDKSGATFNFQGVRKSTSGVPMEAYAGWGAGTLRYVQNANNRDNEFWNPDTKLFDYDWYLKQHPEQKVPDICLINFGINATNRYVTDSSELKSTQTENIQFIIDQIKDKNPNYKFIIGLTHSAARWSNFVNDSSARREEISAGVEQLINDFQYKEGQNIYLNPMYLSLDPRWDMQYSEISSNHNNSAHKTYQGLDSHHPSKIGYRNNGWTTVAAIKAVVSGVLDK